MYSKIENTSIEKINQAHSHQKKLSALSLTEKKKKRFKYKVGDKYYSKYFDCYHKMPSTLLLDTISRNQFPLLPLCYAF